MRQAHEIFKKGADVDLHTLSNKHKAVLVEALHTQYELPELLSFVGLARSSYFYYRAKLKLADKYEYVRRSITEIFDADYLALLSLSQGAGIPTQIVHGHLGEGGLSINEARVIARAQP